MKPVQLCLAAVLLAASVCHAKDDIYKCTGPAGTSFQSQPCEAGAVMSRISIAKHDQDVDEEDEGAPAAKRAPLRNVRPGLYSRGDMLEPGMSDLQVLNNRRWGKPQRITRSRESSVGWHEYWVYQTGANGGKQLHFINGLLRHVENVEPAGEASVQGPSMVSVVMMNDR